MDLFFDVQFVVWLSPSVGSWLGSLPLNCNCANVVALSKYCFCVATVTSFPVCYLLLCTIVAFVLLVPFIPCFGHVPLSTVLVTLFCSFASKTVLPYIWHDLDLP